MAKTLLIICLLLAAVRVQAIAVYPSQTPLQPAPENTFPNYSGNVQSGAGAEENQQGSITEQEIEQGTYTEEDQAADEQNRVEAQNYGSIDGFSVLAGVCIVLVSAAVAWGYYKIRTRNQKK